MINNFAESICNHYSNLSGRPDIFRVRNFKKQGPKYGVKKAGCKKQGHSKREEEAALFSFRLKIQKL